MIPIFVFVLLAIVLILAARHDWHTKQIPNVYPLTVLGVAIVGVLTGMTDLPSAVIGAALGAIPMLIIHFIWHIN